MASDMSPEYLAKLHSMTGAQKLRTAFGLYWSARKGKARASASSIPTGRRSRRCSG